MMIMIIYFVHSIQLHGAIAHSSLQESLFLIPTMILIIVFCILKITLLWVYYPKILFRSSILNGNMNSISISRSLKTERVVLLSQQRLLRSIQVQWLQYVFSMTANYPELSQEILQCQLQLLIFTYYVKVTKGIIFCCKMHIVSLFPV